MKRSLQVSLCVVCLLAFAVSDASAQTTALFIDSQPGDIVGQGQDVTWTPATTPFSVLSASPARVEMLVGTSGGSAYWRLEFSAAAGATLAPRDYEDATRVSSATLGPRLGVTNGTGCNVLSGRFRLYEIAFDSGGSLLRFAADFEQHCEDLTPALSGALRYNAVRSSLVPFDGACPLYALRVVHAARGYVTGAGLECGAGRTDCDEVFATPAQASITAIPATGYVR